MPTCLKETEHIEVTIVCASETKYDHVKIQTDSLLGATRFINAYQPKRGYKVVMVQIQEVLVLQ